ncbi:hypothetical protein MHI18_07305 [Peribacillus sp. FSL H8-0477]|uniref:hypothetical protein n=1 Tax=Peribacillus sp. FSL H8-0477 TaxID=2921388 RepID=UPI0030F9F8D3
MECICEKKSFDLKIAGDVGADPIWCNRCGCNLDIEDIPISIELIRELKEWINMYGEWIDWDKDILLSNGIQLEEEHNEKGLNLTEKIKDELKGEYKIIFSPSTTVRTYEKKKGKK